MALAWAALALAWLLGVALQLQQSQPPSAAAAGMGACGALIAGLAWIALRRWAVSPAWRASRWAWLYVGRTRRTLVARWVEHLESAAKGAEKVLYEYLRHDPTGFHIIELDSTETASEAAWQEAFNADVWQVLNEIGGNRKTPKKRDTEKERVWREMNANAEAALNRREQPVSNPNRLNEILAEVRSRVGSSWERFAAANPGYVAAIGTDKSLRLNDGSAT